MKQNDIITKPWDGGDSTITPGSLRKKIEELLELDGRFPINTFREFYQSIENKDIRDWSMIQLEYALERVLPNSILEPEQEISRGARYSLERSYTDVRKFISIHEQKLRNRYNLLKLKK